MLRGAALLGILIINLRYFAMPLRALNDPSWSTGVIASSDFWAWFGGTQFFEDTMITLFSMLFGAGIVLTAKRSLLLHLSRQSWFLVIAAAQVLLPALTRSSLLG